MDDDGLFVAHRYGLTYRPDKLQYQVRTEIGVKVLPVLQEELVHKGMVTLLGKS